MRQDITFTTTAICRPDISKLSLDSLQSSLAEPLKDFKVILNVDPFPDRSLQQNVVELFKKYFGEVVVNTPKKSNFASAVKWTWQTANSDFIFHYEDDWLFNTAISIENLLGMFDKSVQQVNLRAYSYVYKNMILSPSIIRKQCYKAFATGLVPHINPEIQLMHKHIFNFKPKMIKTFGESVIISDIGRDWLKRNNIKRYKELGKKKSQFISY